MDDYRAMQERSVRNKINRASILFQYLFSHRPFSQYKSVDKHDLTPSDSTSVADLTDVFFTWMKSIGQESQTMRETVRSFTRK
jgi:hypothetical protein